MLLFFKFITGTVIGSFVFLTVTRNLRNESIIFPNSHCDTCQHQLRWFELIPLFSFLILGGRCSHCNHKIPRLNFLVELILGSLGSIATLSISGLIIYLAQIILIMLSIHDLKTYQIPIPLTIGLEIIASIGFLLNQGSFIRLIEILTIYVSILLVNKLRPTIGNGDLDIMLIIMLLNGFHPFLIAILIASFSAIIYYVLTKNKLIPYVPFLTLGFVVTTLV